MDKAENDESDNNIEMLTTISHVMPYLFVPFFFLRWLNLKKYHQPLFHILMPFTGESLYTVIIYFSTKLIKMKTIFLLISLLLN